jgi:spore coat polysaccharide biosynthesis protein SpsF
MKLMTGYKTEQEAFWAGEFGDDYSERNTGTRWVESNQVLFSQMFAGTDKPDSVMEFGANIGLNLLALKQLIPNAELSAIEINQQAVARLQEIEGLKVYAQSILDFEPDYQREFVFSKGVLIHIAPEQLGTVYELLYASSSRFIGLAEYYNPTPVEISYRGHSDRLFKRDFAGEMLDKFPDLKLRDCGFAYHRAEYPQDDLTWFLLEKD